MARYCGRFDEATARLHESLRIGSAANDTLVIGMCLCQLGALALERHELDEARYLLNETAAMGRELSVCAGS